jgi:hypothetical protein
MSCGLIKKRRRTCGIDELMVGQREKFIGNV